MRVLLVVYDNGSYVNYFPMGTAYIAASLQQKWTPCEIYNQDIHHYPEEHLTQYLDREHFDVVGLGVIAGYYQYKKLLGISEAVNKSKNRPFYVLGGHGPTPEPEYFLKKTMADAIVMGEGEETIVDLLSCIENRTPLRNVKGIAYRVGNVIEVNKRRPLIKDVDSIPFPLYDAFPMDLYRMYRPSEADCKPEDFLMLMLSARGCNFKCNFCFRMDEGCRVRKPDSIVEEIRLLKNKYGISYVGFYDELLMVSESRTLDLCDAMLQSDLNVKWVCSGRLNFAKPNVLQLMKKAGCTFINYGIESFDNAVLKNMNKSLNTKIIEEGVQNTLKAGISPGLNFIFGNIGDNRDTLNKSANFLIKYSDHTQLRTIRPVTPYPGCPLYYYAIERGLLKGVEDFYENKHVNSDLLSVNFTDLSDEEFYEALTETNISLIEHYFQNKLANSLEAAKNLYTNRDASFRGFRVV